MKTVIIKFGGTSVSTKSNIDRIISIVSSSRKNNPIIVVSALSGVTDLLLSIALEANKASVKVTIEKLKDIHRKLIVECFQDQKARSDLFLKVDKLLLEVKRISTKKINRVSSDLLVSYGEIMSSLIISEALRLAGIPSRQVIATDVIVTDTNHKEAEFLIDETRKKATKKLIPIVRSGRVPVVTGFIGATIKGKTTTLGRGGSDYSAAIIGYSLSSSEIQIWTDVNGIYTTDPRLVKQASIIPEISYREASELAFFGAKVLHPRTIRPAVKARIPLRVLNTFNPESPGTLILEKPKNSATVTAISFKKNITLVNMYSTSMLFTKGFLVKLFEIYAKNKTSIDLVSASEVSISVTLDNDDNLGKVVGELRAFTSVTYTKNVSIVSVIGDKITSSTNVIRTIFDLLDRKRINVKMISLGATDINVSLVISSDRLEEAVKVLHKGLLEKKDIK